MKWILLSILSVASPTYAAVKSSYTLTMSKSSDEFLYWQHRELQKTNVYVIGFHNSNGSNVEQVMPKSEFKSTVKKLKDWRKNILHHQTAFAGPLCTETVIITEDNGAVPLCLQGIPRSDKVGFLRWFRQQTDVVAGRI